ncbi:MAG: methylated-DNA--[protein]-cysteine S-methyltransferase [Flavobacteriaceae bacterium]
MTVNAIALPPDIPSIAGQIDPADYAAIRAAIAVITENWREQPSLERIAGEAGVDPARLQKIFRRWAGITPKQFVQAITLDHARGLLSGEASVLDTAYEVGLSGPGRLHDLFVTHEAMTPGDFRARGAGLLIDWGFHPSPFGYALVMATDRGLAGLAFADDPSGFDAALADMTRRWPRAQYRENAKTTEALAKRIFDRSRWREEEPLRVVLIGTDFEVRVWETLLRIPFARAATYSQIASKVCTPKAARAVGAAVGKNPLSFVVPCHRVLGAKGALTGYHWGLTRKRAMLGWEQAVSAA